MISHFHTQTQKTDDGKVHGGDTYGADVWWAIYQLLFRWAWNIVLIVAYWLFWNENKIDLWVNDCIGIQYVEKDRSIKKVILNSFNSTICDVFEDIVAIYEKVEEFSGNICECWQFEGQYSRFC